MILGFISRALFDGVEQILPNLVTVPSRSVLTFAGLIGRSRQRLSGRWPEAREVTSLFPEIANEQAERMAQTIAAHEAMNRLVTGIVRSPERRRLEPFISINTSTIDSLPPRAILATFHVGTIYALGLALERLPKPVLALRHGHLHRTDPPLELVTTEGGLRTRAAAFRRSVAHLRKDGYVLIAADVRSESSLRVTCLGKPLSLARGPFALARITGVPIVPLVARWSGQTIEIVTGEPLQPEASAGVEASLAAAAGEWLERYLSERPSDIGLGLLRTLLGHAEEMEEG